MGCVVQSIQKEHGLDNYQKVKKESVLEMVSFHTAETCHALVACRGGNKGPTRPTYHVM